MVDKYRPKVNLVYFSEKGVGCVFRKSIKIAAYDKIISQDMDLSTDLNFIPKAIGLLDSNDVVIGSKKMGSQERSTIRKIPSTVFIFLVRLLLGLPYKDYSMAAKAYKKSAVSKYLGRIDYGSSYVIDLIYFIKKNGGKLIEIPVSCHDKRKSKFNIFHESIYRFKNLVTLFFQHFL